MFRYEELSTLRKLILFKKLIASGIKVVSGAIASFVTKRAENAKSLKVALEPIQSLNGYDKPWSGGNGVNLFDKTAALDGYIDDADGELRQSGNSSKSTDFIRVEEGLSYYGKSEQTAGMWGAWYDENKNYLSGVTRYANSVITAPTNAKYMRLTVIYNESGNLDTFAVNYPSTVTTYSPYSNICPIYGRTECVTEVCGKNLWDTNGNFSLIDCYLEQGGSQQRVGREVHLPTGTYTIKLSIVGNGGYIYLNKVNRSGEFLSFVYLTTGRDGMAQTVTLADGDYLLIFDQQARTAEGATHFGDYNIQIELGSTATSYESYQGTSYTTDLGRTVYGGEVDVVSGVLTDNRGVITFDGTESWVKSSSGNAYYLTLSATTFPYGKTNAQYNVCNSYGFKGFTVSGYDSYLSDGEYLLYDYPSENAIREIAFKNESITSVADWKSSLQSNPITVCYELATPQTYQLTPTEVQLLLGTNNVWSDGGNVEVTYRG